MDEKQTIIRRSLLTGDILILFADGFWQKINVHSISNLSKTEMQNQYNKLGDQMDDSYSILKIDF
jgi:hypothetical protein